MTIGIATISPDAVILVADGRERFVKKGTIVTDEKNKIINIQNTFALIPVGVSEITEYATKFIKLNYKSHFNAEQICSLIDLSLKTAWNKKVASFPEDIDLESSNIHASFLVAGFVNTQPFISGIARKHNSYQPYYIANEPIQFLIACNNQSKAAEFYDNQLCQNLGDDDILDKLKNVNDLILKCGYNTAKFMENFDESIGGKIQYAIIQSNKSFFQSEYKNS